ncbi:MAG: homoserine O-succinyltransferase [Chitinispirillaceae bacterium]|nr:homoserine O-succinyltransferase [Chitinispirillaceae bacterium]
MTIVIPRDYHAKDALERRRIRCIDQDVALREDIRALRIGILNIMPRAETYEFSLLNPLGRSVLQIEPVFIRLENHKYGSTSREHLDKLYVNFEDAIKDDHLDGLIVTGAPVEDIPFEEISYWEEIRRILKYARNNIPSTLGMCWGALALAKSMGLEKTVYPRKIFGVFLTRNLDRGNRITGDLDDLFWCPQSRHSGIADELLEQERDRGTIHLLALSPEGGGYTILESSDRRFIMHLGHPEYGKNRLREEYVRDKSRGRSDVALPLHYDLEHPVNNWRSHRNEFFGQWIKGIHDTTSF